MKKKEYESPDIKMFDVKLNESLLSASNPDAVSEDFINDGSFDM